MTILLCPDSFKESLNAIGVAENIATGIRKVLPEARILLNPMSDGGDGAINLLEYYLGVKKVTVNSRDPLNRSIKSAYLIKEDEAWISLSESSGLHLLVEQAQNPLKTSTIGTGLVIRDAVENGVKKINLFLGGSATNDGGIGILQAFGWKFMDKDGRELAGTGQSLNKVHSINPGKKINECKFHILTDVRNPLTGQNGATMTFASQKGAKKGDLHNLESGMKNILQLFCPEKWESINKIEGIGAAGGTSLGLMQLSDVEFGNGFNYFADLSDLNGKIDQADIVITGEGQFNHTSLGGKVCGEIIRRCKSKDKLVIGLFGSIDKKTEVAYEKFIPISIQNGIKPKEIALKETESDLQYTSRQIAKLLSHVR